MLVFDIVLENVSLIQSCRAELADLFSTREMQQRGSRNSPLLAACIKRKWNAEAWVPTKELRYQMHFVLPACSIRAIICLGLVPHGGCSHVVISVWPLHHFITPTMKTGTQARNRSPVLLKRRLIPCFGTLVVGVCGCAEALRNAQASTVCWGPHSRM